MRLKTYMLLIQMLVWSRLALPVAADPEYWQAFQAEIPLQNTVENAFWQPDRFHHFTLGMLGPRYQGIGTLRFSNGPSWDFGPHLSMSLLGELVYTNNNGQSPSTEYRLLAEPAFKGRWGDIFSWVDRNGLEYRIFPDKTSWRYRNLLRINWKLNQTWSPFVANEIFYDINQGFNQNRARIGVGYNWDQNTRIDFGYMARSSKSPDNLWRLDHILTLFLYFAPPDPNPLKEDE